MKHQTNPNISCYPVKYFSLLFYWFSRANVNNKTLQMFIFKNLWIILRRFCENLYIANMYSHIALWKHTENLTVSSSLTVHSITAHWGDACHHGDKQQGHQGSAGQRGAPAYKEPDTADRRKRGFILPLLLWLHLLFMQQIFWIPSEMHLFF